MSNQERGDRHVQDFIEEEFWLRPFLPLDGHVVGGWLASPGLSLLADALFLWFLEGGVWNEAVAYSANGKEVAGFGGLGLDVAA